MGRVVDMMGRRFSRLSILRQVENTPRGRAQWLCLCDCGKEVIYNGVEIRNGRLQSCGCLHAQRARENGTAANLTHGHSSGGRITPEYRTWSQMRERCNSPKHISFARYGGRGIRVCERWDSFESFLEDMGPKPSGRNGSRSKYSLDRIDNEGNYEPGNCRWATVSEQSRNTCKTVHVFVDGEKLVLQEALNRTGINPGTYWYRLHRLGLSPEEAIKLGRRAPRKPR